MKSEPITSISEVQPRDPLANNAANGPPLAILRTGEKRPLLPATAPPPSAPRRHRVRLPSAVQSSNLPR